MRRTQGIWPPPSPQQAQRPSQLNQGGTWQAMPYRTQASPDGASGAPCVPARGCRSWGPPELGLLLFSTWMWAHLEKAKAAPQFTRQMYHSGWPGGAAVSITSSGAVAPGTYETGGSQGVGGPLPPIPVPSPWMRSGSPARHGTAGPHLPLPTEPLVREPWWAGRPAGQGHPHPLRHHLRLWLHRDADHVLDCGRGESSLGWLRPSSCTIPSHPVPP